MKATLLLLVCFLFINCSWETGHDSGQPSAKAVPAAGEDEGLAKSLEAAGEKLAGAIRKRDSRELLALFSPGGAEVGIDNWLTHDQLQQDVQGRGLVYCQFFETECFQEMLRKRRFKPFEDIHGEAPWPVSYHQVITTATGQEISVRVHSSESDSTWGVVILHWDSPDPRYFGLQHFLEFTFRLEDGDWKLSSDGGPY